MRLRNMANINEDEVKYSKEHKVIPIGGGSLGLSITEALREIGCERGDKVIVRVIGDKIIVKKKHREPLVRY